MLPDGFPVIEDPILQESLEFYRAGKLKDGTIRKWDLWKGFGWIRPDDGSKEVFLYQKQLSESLRERHMNDQLTAGTKVMFTDEKKPGARGTDDRNIAIVCICPSEARMQLAPRFGEPVVGVFSPVGVHKPQSLRGQYAPDRGGAMSSRSSPYELGLGSDEGTTVRIGAAQMAQAMGGDYVRVQGPASEGTTVRVDANTVRVTGSPDGQTVRITGSPSSAGQTVNSPASDVNWWGSFMSACMEYQSPQLNLTAPAVMTASASTALSSTGLSAEFPTGESLGAAGNIQAEQQAVGLPALCDPEFYQSSLNADNSSSSVLPELPPASVDTSRPMVPVGVRLPGSPPVGVILPGYGMSGKGKGKGKGGEFHGGKGGGSPGPKGNSNNLGPSEVKRY